MTPQQILIVAVRLFAIFWFLNSIGHLVAAMRAVGSVGVDGAAALAVGVPLLELLVCVLLWFFPATVSRRLLKDGGAQAGTVAPALLEWQSMLVIVLGLWTLSNAIPDGVYFITYFLTYHRAGIESGARMSGQWPSVAATVAQFAIGAWLLLGARGLAALLLQLRTAGVRP